jgi:hypothetical protein
MRTHTVFPFLAVGLFLVAVANPSYALTYSVLDNWGGTYADAEKSPVNSEDDYMCWAAAASNILAWSGWANVAGQDFSSADAVFAYFQDHWTDEGGNAYYGWDWWFDGTNDSPGDAGWSQVDVAGGGFWKNYDFNDYNVYTTVDQQAMEAMDSYLHDGYGVVLGITNDSGGHAITAWGYEYDQYGDYLGIYVTDSDDSKGEEGAGDVLAYYDVYYKGKKWYLQDFYGTDGKWYISEVGALAQAPEEVRAVPLPSTLFLCLSGLLGVAAIRRRGFRL